ncbi:MAG: hypothetical protein ACI4GB_00585 [Acutalibacteraceae bacterium]
MNDKRFLKILSALVVLLVFSVLALSSCSRKSPDDGISDSVTSAPSSDEVNNRQEESDGIQEKGSTPNSQPQSEKDGEASIIVSTASEETTKNTDSVPDYQVDSSSSITVKNTVVNRSLKIESIGESNGVLSVSVQNVSDQDIEYCVLKCHVDDKEAFFAFSVLPKNECAVALEMNGLPYQKDMKFSLWSMENRVDFAQEISLYDDVFDVKCEGNYIEIKNKTQNDISGKIKICYKNLQSQTLYGSDAYLLSVDGLKKGETKQIFSRYLDSEKSRVIYIKYDQ